MTIKTTVQKESLAQKYASDIVEASLHDADPGTTGASEVADTRVAVSWTVGTTDGAVEAELTWTPDDDLEVAFVGLWGAGDSFRDYVFSGASVPASTPYIITLRYIQE